MTASDAEVFNKFHLLALNHLERGELINADGSINQKAKRVMLERIEEGKRLILKHTKKGDKIAFETPFETTYEDFVKMCRDIYRREYGARGEEMLQTHWHEVLKTNLHFYHSLAEFAKDHGRVPISLDTASHKPASKLLMAYLNEPAGTERKKRLEYLMTLKRDDRYINRIKRDKPKMAVMGSWHALMVEAFLQPKQATYIPHKGPQRRQLEMQERLAMHQRYFFEKLEKPQETLTRRTLLEKTKRMKRKGFRK